MNDLYHDDPLYSIERCPACENDEHPIYVVRAKDIGATIGSCKWNGKLNEYCFYPRPNTAWNWDVLFHVLNFLVDVLTDKVLQNVGGPTS